MNGMRPVWPDDVDAPDLKSLYLRCVDADPEVGLSYIMHAQHLANKVRAGYLFVCVVCCVLALPCATLRDRK